MIPKDLLNFLESSVTCDFQFNLLSSMSPKYLILLDSKIVVRFNNKVNLWLLLLGGLKIKNSVLSVFNERRLSAK